MYNITTELSLVIYNGQYRYYVRSFICNVPILSSSKMNIACQMITSLLMEI